MSESLFGIHAVEAALQEGSQVSELILARSDKKAGFLEKLAREQGVAVTRIGQAQMDERFPGQAHQGVACVVTRQRYHDEAYLDRLCNELDAPFFLVLDQIQDPRNFGACLRTAEAAGIDAVIFPKDRSSELTPVAAKTAAGAGSRLPLVRVTNLAQCLKRLKEHNVWLTGADGGAEQSLYDVDLAGRTAIVVGNEGKGLRRLSKEACDFLAFIPMAGQAESLNVSVATGVFLFEAVRQRSQRVSSR